jgi:hypothetical protein
MQKLIIEQSLRTPGITFSPDENIFYVRGESSPEDVRKLYYPVIEWIKKFCEEFLKGEIKTFSKGNPLRFQYDLKYFNSSSAKFFFDMLTELKKLTLAGCPVIIEWYFEDNDPDMKEAGSDLSQLVDMEFTLIPKPS